MNINDMKARIKKTGEIIEVLGISKEYGTAQYVDSTGTLRIRGFNDNEIEIIKESEVASINWEQRRYELAKEAMGAFIASASYQFCANNNYYEVSIATAEYIAKDAVNYADALIAELRKPTPDDEFSSIVEQAPSLHKALEEIKTRAEVSSKEEWANAHERIYQIAKNAIIRCKKGGDV